MKLFATIARALRDSLINSGRMHSRAVLLRMSEKELAANGFSRAKLEAGIHTWPWRIDSVEPETVHSPSPAAEMRRAIKELNAYSDRELNDLGLSRLGIADAVLYGQRAVASPFNNQDRQRVA